MEIIWSFGVCQLLRNAKILNLDKYNYYQSKFSKENHSLQKFAVQNITIFLATLQLKIINIAVIFFKKFSCAKYNKNFTILQLKTISIVILWYLKSLLQYFIST